MTMPMYWGNIPETQNKGNQKRGKQLPVWANQKQDPARDVNARIDWALKTNERPLAKKMPLLGEFSGYSGWGKEAKMWEKTLYNHPVSSVIDYFILNLRESSDIMDRKSSGHLERKLKIKVGENEESVKNRVEFGPINVAWACAIFRARHYEPVGRPISRITKQLNNPDTVIWKELGIG